MNLVIVQQDDFCDVNRVLLKGRRHTHIKTILGAERGKTLQVGLLNGKVGTGTVIDISDGESELEVILEHEPPGALPLHLLLAMPRPKAFKRLLQGITALGIKQITLLNTWKVDKSYWQSPALAPEILREQCILGLEQSRDTILPTIDIQPRFKPFVEDILPTLTTGTRAFVAHPGAPQPCPEKLQEQTILAIGPEGGFTDYEVAKLQGAGMELISLGERPLRVETAVPALVGRLAPF